MHHPLIPAVAYPTDIFIVLLKTRLGGSLLPASKELGLVPITRWGSCAVLGSPGVVLVDLVHPPGPGSR